MKAIVFDRCGPPEEVLQVRDLPDPKPAADEVRRKLTPGTPRLAVV